MISKPFISRKSKSCLSLFIAGFFVFTVTCQMALAKNREQAQRPTSYASQIDASPVDGAEVVDGTSSSSCEKPLASFGANRGTSGSGFVETYEGNGDARGYEGI